MSGAERAIVRRGIAFATKPRRAGLPFLNHPSLAHAAARRHRPRDAVPAELLDPLVRRQQSRRDRRSGRRSPAHPCRDREDRRHAREDSLDPRPYRSRRRRGGAARSGSACRSRARTGTTSSCSTSSSRAGASTAWSRRGTSRRTAGSTRATRSRSASLPSTSCTARGIRPAASSSSRAASPSRSSATCCSAAPSGRTDIPGGDHAALIGVDQDEAHAAPRRSRLPLRPRPDEQHRRGARDKSVPALTRRHDFSRRSPPPVV